MGFRVFFFFNSNAGASSPWKPRFSGKPSALLTIAVIGIVLLPAYVFSGGQPLKPLDYGRFDFPTCIRYALVHSDAFTQSRLDIQIKSADVKDAHAEILPTLQLFTRYYLTRAGGNSGSGKFSIQLFMTNWDPFLALLKIKSNSILVDMARISHREQICDNTGKMAKLFYRIDLLERMIRARRQILALQQNKLDYAKSRIDQGAYEPMDLRAMQNTVRGENIRIRDMEREREVRLGELKTYMGFPPDYELPLDTRDAVNQVLTGFIPQLVTFGNVQTDNLHLRLLAKKEQLQSNRVMGSYVALVPKPLLVFEQVDNQVDRTSGFNFALGLDYTIWDGFKRVRDIKRQKMIGEQLRLDRNQYSERTYQAFKKIRAELADFSEKDSYYREQARLAEMSEEKGLILYKAGDVNYEQYIGRRVERVEAEVSVINNAQGRVDALIDLAVMAGGLSNYNAGIRY
jgi:outer membrane protein TolC